MISSFPDLNVWVALSLPAHSHHMDAWRWLNQIGANSIILFSRYTQMGLLRMLTNASIRGDYVHSVQAAWMVYDRWLSDARVRFYSEPRGIDAAFRSATAPFANVNAPKSIGDCYLLAFAKTVGATLVSFDKALIALAERQDCGAVIPA